jgi:hypothetical protein
MFGERLDFTCRKSLSTSHKTFAKRKLPAVWLRATFHKNTAWEEASRLMPRPMEDAWWQMWLASNYAETTWIGKKKS